MLAEIIWNHQSLTILMVFSIPILVIVGVFWVQLEKTRSLNELKRSMVERGMSADDIERVVRAGQGDSHSAPTGNHSSSLG